MFWDRFYNLCLQHGFKPNPVAKEIGISSAILTKWKNSQSYPNGEMLIKIADYFNCSLDYLTGRSNFDSYNSKFSEKDTILLSNFHKLDKLNQEEVLAIISIKLNSSKRESFSISQNSTEHLA